MMITAGKGNKKASIEEAFLLVGMIRQPQSLEN